MSPPRTDPPGLDALAQAVARYQAQLAQEKRQKRTTRELAVKAGKATAPVVISITAAVALSQLIGSIWSTSTSMGDRVAARAIERVEHHNDSSSAHKTELDKLRAEAAYCRASLERIELQLLAPDAPLVPDPRRTRRRR